MTTRLATTKDMLNEILMLLKGSRYILLAKIGCYAYLFPDGNNLWHTRTQNPVQGNMNQD